jgi:carbonic anhydrase
MLARPTLREDALAGVAVLGPSLALALLVAQHAGLPPTATLITVVVASFVVAIFGGSSLGLSGPGLAMGLVLVDLAHSHGAAGLALACVVTGGLQILVGALGLGRFGRLVPLPAVHAFTFGLGAILIVQSLPYTLGLDRPGRLQAVHVIDHLTVHAPDARLAAAALATVTVVAVLVGARRSRRAPIAVLVVALGTLVTFVAGLDLPTLPDLPLAAPETTGPQLPDHEVTFFLGGILVLVCLASLETLLSATADEESTPGTRNDLGQELIGHGVANVVLGLIGGVPATGSIARSRAMRAAGARTRAAAVVHALVGAALVPLILVVDRWVPVAVLAGVVIALAVPLLDPRPLLAVARVSRAEAIVAAVTVVVLVFGDLLSGIEAALVATLVLAMLRVARFRVSLHEGSDGAPHQVSLSGPITFLAIPELDRMRGRLASLDPSTGAIIDVRSVLAMDVSGCARFLSVVSDMIDRLGRVAVLGASPRGREMLLATDRRGVLANRMAVTDRDVDAILGQERAFEMRAHVIANLERFRVEMRQHYTPLFDQLASGQHPHTLFVTCVDSRISPTMFTGAHPGELFILRCLGAMVPPPTGPTLHAEGAAVEYAIGVLGVRNIVICGHSQCGAIKAIKTGHVPDGFPSLREWLAGAKVASGDLSTHEVVDDAARAVTVRQLENLRRFPAVRDQLASGALRLHAWFYDVGAAELFEWSEATGAFCVLGERDAPPAPVAAPVPASASAREP